MEDIQFVAWTPPAKAQARKSTACKQSRHASKVTEGNYASCPLPETVPNQMSLGLTLPSKTPTSHETEAGSAVQDASRNDNDLDSHPHEKTCDVVDPANDSSSDVDSLFDDEDQVEHRRSKRRKTSDDSASTTSLHIIEPSLEKGWQHNSDGRRSKRQRSDPDRLSQSMEESKLATRNDRDVSDGSRGVSLGSHGSHKPTSGLTFPVASQALPRTSISSLTFPVASQGVPKSMMSRTTSPGPAQDIPELPVSGTASPTTPQAVRNLQAHLSGTSRNSVTRLLRALVSVFSEPDEGHLVVERMESLKQLPKLPIDAELQPIFNALATTFQNDATFQTSLMAFLLENLQSADVDWEEVCTDPVEMVPAPIERWDNVDKMSGKEKNDEIVRLRGRLAETSRLISRLGQSSARLREKHKGCHHYKRIAQRPLFAKEQAEARAAARAAARAEAESKGHYLRPAELAHYKHLLEEEKRGFPSRNAVQHDSESAAYSSAFGVLLLHRTDTDLHLGDSNPTPPPVPQLIDLSTPEPCERPIPVSVPETSLVTESAVVSDPTCVQTAPYFSPYPPLFVQASLDSAHERIVHETAREASSLQAQSVERNEVTEQAVSLPPQADTNDEGIQGAFPSWNLASTYAETGLEAPDLNYDDLAALVGALDQELLDELDTSGLHESAYNLPA